MVADAFARQIAGYGLTTARILYRMPDHPSVLQEFIWQTYDLAPEFPELTRFVTFCHLAHHSERQVVQPSRPHTVVDLDPTFRRRNDCSIPAAGDGRWCPARSSTERPGLARVPCSGSPGGWTAISSTVSTCRSWLWLAARPERIA